MGAARFSADPDEANSLRVLGFGLRVSQTASPKSIRFNVAISIANHEPCPKVPHKPCRLHDNE